MGLNPLLLSSFLLSFLLGWLWLRKATGSRLKFMARDGRDHFERAQARRSGGPRSAGAMQHAAQGLNEALSRRGRRSTPSRDGL